MHEEIAALRPCLEGLRTERRAGRDFHFGRLDGHDVVLVRCGIGKVAAATTTAVLLDAYDARALLPDALAVEMEGAAVAQVCHDFARPFGVVRTISDRADDTAHVDFQRFVRDVAAPYSRDIVRAALAS